MAIEDQMEQSLAFLRVSLTGARPIPRKRLSNLIASADSLHSLLQHITIRADLAPEGLIGGELGLDGQSRPLRQTKMLGEEFLLVLERNNDSSNRLNSVERELAHVRRQVQAENRRVVGGWKWEGNWGDEGGGRGGGKLDDRIDA